MKVVSVIVELGIKSINHPFSYILSEHFSSKNIVGKRVLVPFGKQTYQGFVLEVNDEYNESEIVLKEVIDVIDDEPVLNDEFIKLGKYLSEDTYSYLITAYQAMLPKALKAKKGSKVNIKCDYFVELINLNEVNTFIQNEKRAKKQVEALVFLKENVQIKRSEFNKLFSQSILKNLIDRGFVKVTTEEIYREVFKTPIEKSQKLKLNTEQQSVYDEIINSKNRSETFLLYGVTGSGKTEVYMQVIEEVIADGKEAIVLVPEIALTKQIISRFKSRFGDHVAILHSRLSAGEKYDEYRKIYRKEVKIVVGARSAIFAPFENIGVIIIDEEHESTYKQENNPKYHALDVALFRSKEHNCPVILGSATPSLESFARAKKKVYKLLTLKNRVNNRALPKVDVIDMKEELKSGNYSIFSRKLKEAIQNRIELGQQVILLLNRRGYSTVVTCRSCGHTIKCPHCDISLTYHKHSNKITCHYCNYFEYKPKVCSNCKSDKIREFGLGTEKLEELIIKEISGAKVIRMDADTTSKKESHERMISDFEKQKYNILLGTQMIAKGLDFENVTLVGVLNADYSLNLPDFRSSERTFQLLSQVSGRAGRKDLSGEVIIQTYNDNHYSIDYAKNHDYYNFFIKEMDIRHKLGYPPYFYLTKIIISSHDYKKAVMHAKKVRDKIYRHQDKSTIVLGPSPASMHKLKGRYRFQIIIKYKSDVHFKGTINEIINQYKKIKDINCDFEKNPLRLF